MASPITPFVAIRAFAGVPIEDLDINRSPVETVFQGILVFTTLFRSGDFIDTVIVPIKRQGLFSFFRQNVS